jgi:CelD/BcsL family acetyltransferase involved in cellulose biosynthesis
LLEQKTEGLGPMLSALYVGDRLAAVELGLRAGAVLHRWFPAYDQELAAYSPGLILLVEMARAAPGLGLRRFDMGKGLNQSKSSFMSGAVAVAEGSVALTASARALRGGWQGLRALARDGPLRRPVAPLRALAVRLLAPVRGWLALR